MAMYMKDRDVRLINSINRELINKVIDTTVNFFKLSLYNSKENLYGEALNKIYYPAVQVAGLIEHDDESVQSDEYGTDVTQTITVNLHRETLKDIELYPEVGDYIEYNNKQYEIDNIIENQFLAGQPLLNHSIICEAHLTNNSISTINKIKKVYDENLNNNGESLYD
jgi:hypothetical protein